MTTVHIKIDNFKISCGIASLWVSNETNQLPSGACCCCVVVFVLLLLCCCCCIVVVVLLLLCWCCVVVVVLLLLPLLMLLLCFLVSTGLFHQKTNTLKDLFLKIIIANGDKRTGSFYPKVNYNYSTRKSSQCFWYHLLKKVK